MKSCFFGLPHYSDIFADPFISKKSLGNCICFITYATQATQVTDRASTHFAITYSHNEWVPAPAYLASCNTRRSRVENSSINISRCSDAMSSASKHYSSSPKTLMNTPWGRQQMQLSWWGNNEWLGAKQLNQEAITLLGNEAAQVCVWTITLSMSFNATSTGQKACFLIGQWHQTAHCTHVLKWEGQEFRHSDITPHFLWSCCLTYSLSWF